MYQSNNPNMPHYTQPKQAANPNGGYLKQNQYGLAGTITITPELLAQIQATGKVYISVGRLEDKGYGPSARCTAKPSTSVDRPAAPPVQGGQYYPPQPQQTPQYVSAPPQQYGAPTPPYAPQPAQGQTAPYNPNQRIDDDLPF